MLRIQLSENAPTELGLSFPFLGVSKLVAQLPILPTGQRQGQLICSIEAFRVINDSGVLRQVAHPTAKRIHTIENFSLTSSGIQALGLTEEEAEQVLHSLYLLGAAIARSSEEWSSAEVVND